jgi:putative oxidoreductase
LRRLFSTFAAGPPGVGLLVLRFAVAATLGFAAIGTLTGDILTGQLAVLAVNICLVILLLAGLWTPIVGAIVAILTLGSLFWHRGADVWTHLLLAALGIALALLGPGAWSVDAWRFGWKRIEIPDRHNQSDLTSERER